MALFKLPKIADYNDLQTMHDRTNLFFELCMQYNVSPTVAGYSLSLGVDRHTLYNWLNNKTESIKNKETGTTYILADFDVVAVNNQGKLYRRIPEQLKTKLEEAME